MTTLVLLRHGRTAWNSDLRAQGQTDIALDEEGHRQAATVAPAIAAMRPDLLWSSDLARASQTADHVARATGLPVVTDARLRENDVGERAGLNPTQFAERYPAEHAAWVAGADEPRVPGAESPTEMAARAAPALRDLLAALGPDGVGVAVVHGWCAKVALMPLLGLPVVAAAGFRGMDNCHWAVLTDGATGLRLAAYNVGRFAPVRTPG